MKRVWALCLSAILIVYCRLDAFAQVTGRISYDGAQRPAVVVMAFEASGEGKTTLVATTQADSAGLYKLNLEKDRSFKLVFEYDSKDYEPDRFTPQVRFLRSPSTNVDLKLRSIVNNTAPFLVSSIYTSGRGNDSTFALLALSSEDTIRLGLATSSEIGCVWGLSFDHNRRFLYSSSFAKRHVGYGPLGTGGIYRTNWRTRTTTAWLDLQKLGVETGQDEHQGLKREVDSVSTDPLLMKQVGKVSFGGMDLSPNADTIYLMNLYDRKLYAIHVPADTSAFVKASDVRSFQLPETQISGGQIRPFAVKCYRGKVYVGAVSDASLSQDLNDLNAFVYVLEPESGRFRQLFKVPLDYSRGAAVVGVPLNKWNPWSDEFAKALVADFPSTAVHPQPILSSIAFGLDGEVVLGLMDRFGHLSGPGFPNPEGTASYSGVAAGDVLRVHFAEGERFRVEMNAAVGRTATEGKNNRQGPAGGEFYYQDGFIKKGLNILPRVVHEEAATGSLLTMLDTKELLVSVHEPDQFNSGGVKSFFSQNGKTGRTWQFYFDGERGTFGKANGMGALVLVSQKPVSYIGNRVWEDANANGIQEAGEPGLGHVLMELWHGGKSLAHTITDKDGHYLFDDNNVPGGILANTEYELRAAYQTSSASIFKAGKDSQLDNDAVDMGDFAAAAFKTEDNPVMQHAIDFGFLPKTLHPESIANFIVYPNPVVGQLTVKMSNGLNSNHVSVLDVYGRKMETKTVMMENQHLMRLDLSVLAAGLYIVTVDSPDGKRQSKTIFKLTQ